MVKNPDENKKKRNNYFLKDSFFKEFSFFIKNSRPAKNGVFACKEIFLMEKIHSIRDFYFRIPLSN